MLLGNNISQREVADIADAVSELGEHLSTSGHLADIPGGRETLEISKWLNFTIRLRYQHHIDIAVIALERVDQVETEFQQVRDPLALQSFELRKLPFQSDQLFSDLHSAHALIHDSPPEKMLKRSSIGNCSKAPKKHLRAPVTNVEFVTI